MVLLTITGPSGSGKSTLKRKINQKFQRLQLSAVDADEYGYHDSDGLWFNDPLVAQSFIDSSNLYIVFGVSRNFIDIYKHSNLYIFLPEKQKLIENLHQRIKSDPSRAKWDLESIRQIDNTYDYFSDLPYPRITEENMWNIISRSLRKSSSSYSKLVIT
jgi:adenylate kinase family enzyme